MKYNILTTVPNCPICSAKLYKYFTGSDTIYQCIDCKRKFKVIDMGQSDREVKVVDYELK